MSEQRDAVPLMVLVTGGRGFGMMPKPSDYPASEHAKYLLDVARAKGERRFAFSTLDSVARETEEFSSVGVHIVQGGAEGADALAREWAQDRCVPFTTYNANWTLGGKRAGPLRNQRMLDAVNALPYPMLVLAFPGGRGTADMVRRATAANCEVLHRSPTPSAVTPPVAESEKRT